MAQGKADAWGETIIQGKLVGRDNIVIPPEQVEDLAMLGCNNKEIANFFGVTESALGRNFAIELTTGREILKQKLRRAMLHNACVNMNAAVQIFLAKNILGMTDSPVSADATVLPFSDDEMDDAIEDLEEELENMDATI